VVCRIDGWLRDPTLKPVIARRHRDGHQVEHQWHTGQLAQPIIAVEKQGKTRRLRPEPGQIGRDLRVVERREHDGAIEAQTTDRVARDESFILPQATRHDETGPERRTR
jgi:hypothetical protein